MLTETASCVNWNNRNESHGPDYVCPGCGRPLSCCTCSGRKPAEHVTITQRDGRWNWQRHTAGLIWTSRETYPTATAAAIDAVYIARYNGVAVSLPEDVRAGVAAHFKTVGAGYFYRGLPLAECRNDFKRQGWAAAFIGANPFTAEAEAVLAERESPFAVETEWRVEVYA